MPVDTDLYGSNILTETHLFNRSASQNSVATQLAPVANPFGTLPAMPQMSIGRAGIAPSIQYGISNMPVNMIYPEPQFICFRKLICYYCFWLLIIVYDVSCYSYKPLFFFVNVNC